MLVILIAKSSKCLLGEIIASFTFSFYKVLYPYQEILPEKCFGNNLSALTKKMNHRIIGWFGLEGTLQII